MMQFQKTINFDLYRIGDRVMEDVIYLVELAITADGNVICLQAQPSEDAIPYLESIGGKGAPGHWQQEVLAFFQDEDNCAEELGESMTEEEFNQWSHILCFEQAGAPAEEVAKKNEPRAIKASLASDVVNGWMDPSEYNDLHFGKD